MSPRTPKGIVLVFTDDRGRVIANATDFEGTKPVGYTLLEGQRHRARRALALAVVNAYASPLLVRAIDLYDCERIVERLCSQHGCKVTEIPIGHEDSNA